MAHLAHVLSMSAYLLLGTAVLSPNAAAWVSTPELGYGNGVAMMPNGDVLSCGQSSGADLDDFSVRRQVGLDGTDVWRYVLDGSAQDIPGSYNDFAGDVVLDAAGDVIAAGNTRNTGTGLDLQIVKLAATSGAPIWTKTLDSVDSTNDSYASLAVIAGGDAVVSGTFGISPSFPPTSYAFTVVRVAGATGAPLWQHQIVGNPRSRAGIVRFDPAGDVIVSGDMETAPQQQDAVVAKLDGATGDELWRTVLDGDLPYDYDSAYTHVVDASGDVYMTGVVSVNGGDRFSVYKLSGATGAVVWRYDHPAGADSAEGVALLLDGMGNLYAVTLVGSEDTHLVKLSTAAGLPLWERRYRRTFFTRITSLPDGNFVLAGGYRYNFAIQKVASADGRKQWVRKLRANSYNGGHVYAVAVDTAGQVVAVGGSVTPIPKGKVNGYPSYTVLKACGANGKVRDTTMCP